jgi:hypothetical protein
MNQPVFTITPKTFHSFNIEYYPTEVGQHEWEIEMNTMLNPYECQKIKITGEGYQESVQFEDLPF